MNRQITLLVLLLITFSASSQKLQPENLELQPIADAPQINSCICSYSASGSYKTILLEGSDNETQFCYIQVNNKINKLLMVESNRETNPKEFRVEYGSEMFQVVLEVKYDKQDGYESYKTKAKIRVKSKEENQEIQIAANGSCYC